MSHSYHVIPCQSIKKEVDLKGQYVRICVVNIKKSLTDLAL